MSEAALFRSLAEKPRTVLADEIGKVLAAAGKDRNSDVLRVYLNGFERGWPVQRVVGEGTNQTVVDFDVYGPKVLGGTGQLDDQILDRSWVVNLVRKKSADKVARYRRREAAREATELRQQLEAWAASVEESFADARPDIPNALDDRGQDIAEPLLALADIAGDGWPAKARGAVVALRGGEVEDDAVGVQLLADIRAVWPGEAEIVTTHRLLVRLFEVDTSPWRHEWGENHREMDGQVVIQPNRAAAMKLARALRPFEVKPQNIGPERVKGYTRADFEDAFSRYLPSTPPEVAQVAHSAQPSQEQDFRGRSSDDSLSDLKTAVSGSTNPNERPERPQTPTEGGGEKTRNLVGTRVRCSKHDKVTTVKSIAAGIAYFACGCFVTAEGRP